MVKKIRKQDESERATDESERATDEHERRSEEAVAIPSGKEDEKTGERPDRDGQDFDEKKAASPGPSGA